MADLLQNADGSLSIRNELDGLDIARFGGPKTPSSSLPSWRATKIAKLPLAAIDSGGGIASWINPEAVAILIDGILLDVIAASAGACTVSIGTTAASGTTISNTLIDTLPVNAIGTYDNYTDKGVNGKTRQKLALGNWLTVSTQSGASAGLSGYVYIFYVMA